MKTFRLLAGIALIAPVYAPAAAAQTTNAAAAPDAAAIPDASATDDGDEAPAGAIVVTATRTPTSIDRVPSSITVLDKVAIDRAGDLSVADLLVRTPGVTLSRNGGYGTATQLRIRGAESDQTVVVIDGVKLNDPSAPGSGYNFANLLTGDASRIEVLRGPQSILWGSQAIGGVVNVVTPLPEQAMEGSIDLEGGSRDTVSARAAVGGRTGPLAWRVGAQAFTTRGISATAPAYGGREPDGYRNQSLAARAVLDLVPGVSADLRGYYANGRTDIDGFAGDTLEYGLNRDAIGYAGLNVALLDGRFRNRFAYAYTDTSRDNYNPARARTQTFDAAGRNYRLEYQGTLAIVRGVDAVFGAENEISRFRTVSPPASLSAAIPAPAQGRAEITSFYGQLNAAVLTGLTLTGGLRHDDNNRFGSQTLFSGGGVWALPTDTIIRASYSEGFKAPTLYQLSSEYGNQALRPERATGWEAGVEQRFLDGAVALGGTYFERRTTNLINFANCPSPTAPTQCVIPGTTTPRFGYYDNVSRAFAKGVEAVARIALGERMSLNANYSWIASEDRSPGVVPQQLIRRPRETANAAADYSFPDNGPSFGAAVRWSGASFDTDTNFQRARLSPYTLVDLRAELPLSADVRVFVRGENVFDESYRTIFTYGTLGRSVYAGLRGRF